MGTLSRRSMLRASLGLAAAGTVARPYIANAPAETAVVWWAQGCGREEDDAFRKVVADYQKVSGNKIEFSIVPFAPLRQKIISAITSGVVPDLVTVTPTEAAPLQAWEGRLVDVSDVVATQQDKRVPTALAATHCYDGTVR